jgi:hypothetical protein
VVVQNGKSSALPALLDAEKESDMARPKQSEPSIGLDRRQLLASVAVITTAGLPPIAESAGPAHPTEAANEATLPGSDVPARNVCASTAQKIEEIAARNIIRDEAGLPLLSIPTELRRMKQAADAMAFEEFADRHRQALWEEVLEPVRATKRDPSWRPTRLMEGLAFQAEVGRILRERFDVAGAGAGNGTKHGFRRSNLQMSLIIR